MPLVVNAICIGAAVAILSGFRPAVRCLISWRTIRKLGFRPRDVVEYEYDIAWVKATGPVYTSLGARGGYRIFVPNHLFLEAPGNRGRYSQQQVIQQLPASMLPLLEQVNPDKTISAGSEPIGTIQIADDCKPVLKTRVWLRGVRDREAHVRRALLDEVVTRIADAEGTPDICEQVRKPTVH